MIRARSAAVTAAAALLLPSGVLGSLSAWASSGTPQQSTWNFTQARIPAARAPGHDGAGVVVAVLDTWVDGAHKDFEQRVLAGADCAGGQCRDGAATPDKCDHGTHVAGTIGSSSFGVAPKVTILPVRVLTYDSSSGDCVGQRDDVANGIRWAVAHGAQVLNLSLGADVPGLSQSTAIPDAVSAAAQAGVVVVFSAGNADLPVADSYSGHALIVAATGPSGQLASYSQHGAGVSIAAPGGDPKTKNVCRQDDCITSLYPGNRYAVAAGTSMAAPHVSGVAALLLAQQPGRSRQQVVDRLTSSARPLAGAGAGLLDASAALGTHAGPPPSRTPSTGPVPVVQSPPGRHRPVAGRTTPPSTAPSASSSASSRPSPHATASATAHATAGGGGPASGPTPTFDATSPPALSPVGLRRAATGLPSGTVGIAIALLAASVVSLIFMVQPRRRRPTVPSPATGPPGQL